MKDDDREGNSERDKENEAERGQTYRRRKRVGNRDIGKHRYREIGIKKNKEIETQLEGVIEQKHRQSVE